MAKVTIIKKFATRAATSIKFAGKTKNENMPMDVKTETVIVISILLNLNLLMLIKAIVYKTATSKCSVKIINMQALLKSKTIEKDVVYLNVL